MNLEDLTQEELEVLNELGLLDDSEVIEYIEDNVNE
jgi:hypothetical protein